MASARNGGPADVDQGRRRVVIEHITPVVDCGRWAVKRIAGDRITVDYYQSLAMEVVKVGTAQSGQESVVDTAEPGEKPAIATAKKTTIVATIEAIDRAAPSITLKDSKGNVTKVKVRHPERLKLVKVGDTLKITYREAIAVAVEPAKEAH